MSQTTTQGRRSALDEFAQTEMPKEAPSDNLPAVIEPAVLGVLQRAEIDAQMAMAKAQPRNLKQFRQTVRDLATLNAEVAAECTYVLPGRKKRDGSTGDEIEGPSIRFAEILAYAFSHGRFGARIIEEAYDHVTAQGIFSDQQNNNTTTFELSRRITDSRGRRYGADMINVTKNAACQLAKRNAILQGIPRPLWHDIWEDTRRFAESGGDISFKVNAAVDAFLKAGATEERVLATLGVKTRADIKTDELRRLRGFYTALRDGEATIGEMFPAPAQSEQSSALDKFASAGTGTTAPADSASSVPHAEAGAPADATSTTSTTPAASADLYAEAIDKLLAVATNKQLTVDEREHTIANAQPIWLETLNDVEFVAELAARAKAVANGDQTVSGARRHLEGEAKKRRPA